MARSLLEYFEEVLRTDPRYRTREDVARDLRISSSAAWRQIRNGSIGAEPLLRFAAATGRSPRELLELSGKRDLADLFESVYGEQAGLTDLDRRWLALDPAAKAHVMALVDHLAGDKTAAEDLPIRDGPRGKQSTVKHKRTGS